MINKEAEKLLEENVVFWDNEGEGKIAQLPRVDYDKLLALLKEQPPVSEFTKRAREINNTENVPKWLVRRTLGEACDVIDEKDELLFAYESVRASKQPSASELTKKMDIWFEWCLTNLDTIRTSVHPVCFELYDKVIVSIKDIRRECFARLNASEASRKELEIRNANQIKKIEAMEQERIEEIDALEAEIKRYIEMDKYKSQQSILATKNYNRICKQVEKLEASRKELKELLTEYGRHSPGCSQEFSKKYHCRCGWNNVEATIKKQS